jgi:uncharacterized membrane protein YhiD involved in acid resistance
MPVEVAVDPSLSESFDTLELSRVAWRLGVAAILGALIGIEREWMRKAAGLRTHTTVSLAAATFVLILNESAERNLDVAVLSAMAALVTLSLFSLVERLMGTATPD